MATETKFPRVWYFDENRRVYRKDENGEYFGGPIWREHWRELEVVGETRVSWLTSCHRKIPKKGCSGVAFSEEEIDKQAFVETRWSIGDRVRKCRDYDTLKAIAELLDKYDIT